MNDDRFVAQDRLRYTKNTSSARLVYLAILFDVLFFINIYKSDVGSYYYTILIGVSILYNLIFMLLAFLASEGVKQYHQGYSWLLAVLGVIQFCRILILPVQAHQAMTTVMETEVRVMEDAQFIRTVIWLSLSGLCCLTAAVINLHKSRILKAHLAALQAEQA